MELYKLDLEHRSRERKRRWQAISDRDKLFISEMIETIFHLKPGPEVKVLDFGCGHGHMVNHLASLGYRAYGCDVEASWVQASGSSLSELSLISLKPYRLPYEDDTFDLVFSTSVLEHAQNTEECFREIHRILKVGGISVHLFPGKWYLPYEPHILVPLVNHLWPHVPRWWIALWVWLRAVFIPELRPYWKGMVRKYVEVCRTGIIYLPNSRYRKLSMQIFGNYETLMDYYIAHAGGGYTRLARRLPFRRLVGRISSSIRMNLIVQRKTA